ncbi:MAG: hypothetical protein JSR66_33120 [Proteobacteria bacterium]|nr:hypothetical protein [Pseudomonadota bacterium]
MNELPWFRVRVGTLGRDIVDLQAIFLTAYRAAVVSRGQTPAVMGSFITSDPTAEMRFYYFTPDTQRLAPELLRVVRAEECAYPTEKIDFLTGDEASLRLRP